MNQSHLEIGVGYHLSFFVCLGDLDNVPPCTCTAYKVEKDLGWQIIILAGCQYLWLTNISRKIDGVSGFLSDIDIFKS